MADRFPGGIISKTPPTIVAPDDGEGGTASGVWTLSEVAEYEKAAGWPKKVLPKELFAWGSAGPYGGTGVLGDNTTINKSSPVQIGSDTNWKSISTSAGSSVAVKTDGTLWAWGTNYNGQAAQNNTIPGKISSPVQIGALTTWSQATMGTFTAGAVKTDGTLWMWGNNNNGELGIGCVDCGRSSPIQIGALTNWIEVQAGHRHFFARTSDNSLYAWGQYSGGATAIGTNYNNSSPVQVGGSWACMMPGRAFSVGIKTDGSLWTSGINFDGQLGVSQFYFQRSTPIQVGSLTTWCKVATGSDHAMAIKTDGTLWMWGCNNRGQLGDNTTINKSSPVQIGSDTDWGEVDGSFNHTIATKSKALYSWGGNCDCPGNVTGQLGLNDTINRSSPVQVGTSSFRIIQVAAGPSSPSSTSFAIGTNI